MTVVLVFSAMGLVLFSRPALIILTTREFYGAAAIAPLIILAYFLRSFAEFWRSVFFATNHPGLDAICIVISLAFCVAGYFLLIPRWGMWGAGWATVISFTFMLTLTAAWAHRLWAYYLETRRLVKIVVSAAVLMGVHFLIPIGSLWMQVFWAMFLTILFPASLLALRFLTPAEQAMIGIAWGRLQRGILPWNQT
jgi:O-antigen/teichoic acid export membrane protein